MGISCKANAFEFNGCGHPVVNSEVVVDDVAVRVVEEVCVWIVRVECWCVGGREGLSSVCGVWCQCLGYAVGWLEGYEGREVRWEFGIVFAEESRVRDVAG